jgi:hypothetical protein
MRGDLADTVRTFEVVASFHKAVGSPIAPCEWEAYAATLSGSYGAHRASLESMRRLGFFMVDKSGVRLSDPVLAAPTPSRQGDAA